METAALASSPPGPTSVNKEKLLEYLKLKEKLKILEAQVKLNKLKKRNSDALLLGSARKKRQRCFYHGNDRRCVYCRHFSLFSNLNSNSFSISISASDLICRAKSNLEKNGPHGSKSVVEKKIQSLKEEIKRVKERIS